MFLKQEKPKMDDFERKKTLVLKKNYFKQISIFWENIVQNVQFFKYPCKNDTKYAYSFVSENSKYFH